MSAKNLLVLVAALGSSLALTACDPDFPLGQSHDTATYDVNDKITVIDVHAGSGDIVVNESDRSGVHVIETRHWRGDKPANGHRVDAGTLDLEYHCDICSVDYQLEVPRGLDVKVDTGSGRSRSAGCPGR